MRLTIHKKTGGFTVIELVVAIGVFALVVSALTSTFLAAFRSQRAAFSFLSAQNNVRYVLEVMSREMRTGSGFGGSPAPDNIRFINDRGQIVEYCLAGGAIRRRTGGAACDINSASMTAPNVTVNRLVFLVRGINSGDGAQPRITIVIGMSSGEITMNLQTTVVQRDLDS